MESNRDEASRCIHLTKLYIEKKDLDKAWKFSVKANKLFPSSETKRLMKKLKSSLENSKRRSKKKRNKSESNGTDESYNGDDSNSPSSDDYYTQKRTKNSKQSYKSSTTYSYKMSKEINKDESYKCLEKAEQHIFKKEFELAEKFILKSKKLFPLSKADELLKKLQEMQKTNQKDYTDEQANIVKKVKNSENFYKMLDIETTATVAEIKKAYKKLALLLHPDKNSAPGSGEVFVVVSNAVDTLCDYSKRMKYDQTLKKHFTLRKCCESKFASYTTSNHKCRSFTLNADGMPIVFPYTEPQTESEDEYSDDLYPNFDYYDSFDY